MMAMNIRGAYRQLVYIYDGHNNLATVHIPCCVTENLLHKAYLNNSIYAANCSNAALAELYK